MTKPTEADFQRVEPAIRSFKETGTCSVKCDRCGSVSSVKIDHMLTYLRCDCGKHNGRFQGL